MKDLKYLILASMLVLGLFASGCDDSGTLPLVQQSGVITFSPANLKPLNQSVDGVYQLWVYFDSGAPSWVSLGRFNISASGSMVSESGGDMTFSLGNDTARLFKLKISLVSLETPGMNNPTPSISHIIGSTVTTANIYTDSISTKLTMGNVNAFGSVGDILTADTGRGLYHLESPSTNNADCEKGIWLCDTNQNPRMPLGLNLAPGNGWFYKMWVINNLTTELNSVGTFLNVNAPDDDGAGPCKGPGNGYNAPGQDFIQTGTGCPGFASLSDGNHGTFITLEPVGRTDYSQPFFLRIYEQGRIEASLGCFREDNLFKQYPGRLPSASLRITRAR